MILTAREFGTLMNLSMFIGLILGMGIISWILLIIDYVRKKGDKNEKRKV